MFFRTRLTPPLFEDHDDVQNDHLGGRFHVACFHCRARLANAWSGKLDTDREEGGRRRRVIVETDPAGVPNDSRTGSAFT
jgi:hypothetical protein